MGMGMGMGFKRACPNTFTGAAFGAFKIDGYLSYVLVAGCGTDASRGQTYSETTLIVVIKGVEDYYTLQWSERGPPSDTAIPFDKEKWRSRVSVLSPIKLCQRVDGERPPYPSCMDRK